MRIGVDLGGSKIEAALPDEAGTVRFRHAIPAPRRDCLAMAAAVAGLVEQADSQAGGVRGAAWLRQGEDAG